MERGSGDYLTRAWRLIVRWPWLFVVPLAVMLLGWLLGVEPLAWPSVLGGGVGLVANAVIWLLIAPALASGYNAMVGSAVRGEGGDLAIMTANLGRYHSRILLAGLMAYIVIEALNLLLASWAAWLLIGLAALGIFFIHIWFAAVVLEDVGVREGIRRASDAFAARRGAFMPLLAFSVLIGVLLPFIVGLIFLAGAGNEAGGVGLLLGQGLPAAVSAIVRVAVFIAYNETQ